MKRRGIVEIASALHDILMSENAALRASDFRRAADCLPVKQACVVAFDAFRGTKASDAALGAGVREALAPEAIRNLINQLDSALEENRVLLERAMEVQSRMMSLLANAASATVEAPNCYGARGGYAAGSRPVALALRRGI